MTVPVKRPERSELLMPAGSLENMKTAILYGADAIYCGTPDLSLRTKSSFSLEDVIEGVAYAHERGVRVYLTLNLYTHNKDIEKLPDFLETINKVKPDGVIVADPGVFQYMKENCPDLERHISTQANLCTWLSVNYWKDQGASLAVLAREVSFKEMEEIREKCPDIKLEAFVHGAMCMSYSGRCLLSNFMSERGANQGNCAHSCRWHYKVHMKMKDGRTEELIIDESNKDMFQFMLEEEFRPGDLIPLEETVDGTYFMNAKDMCLMPVLDDYLRIGVDSLKVEGRHKNEFYVGSVTRAYRKAIDDYYEDPENWSSKKYMAELDAVRSRGYTLAFHNGRLTNHSQDYETTASMGEWNFGGFIREWDGDDMIFEVRNTIEKGDVIEFLPPNSEHNPDLEVVRLRLYEFECARTGKTVEKVNPGQKFALRIPINAFHLEDPETFKMRLPVMTVARTEMISLDAVRKDHVKVRERTHQMESGKISEKVLVNIKHRAEEKRGDQQVRSSSAKPPKKKDEGCCGLGCNGCLMFWNDDKYAKAREMLEQKKSGKMLTKDERKVAV